MCKHNHTTEVSTLTELGPVTIHQCDMCGVLVPRKEVSGESSVVFDERAAAVGYSRLIRKVVAIGGQNWGLL